MVALRPQSDARLVGLTAASISDAVGNLFGDHARDIRGLVSPTPERILWGEAVTIDYVPRRNDLAPASFAALLYGAVGDDATGKVLVQSSGGHPTTSTGGGTKLSRLHNLGFAGFLSDSTLRDFHELRTYDFAAWCGGETALRAGKVLMPLRAQVPIQVGGVTVAPGDHVFADRSGAVIIPAGHVDAVLEEAHQCEAKDAASIERIRSEDPATVAATGAADKA